MKIREKLDRFLHPNKLKAYELKYVLPPTMKQRHLVVLASNEEEALLMRRYIIDEGIEC